MATRKSGLGKNLNVFLSKTKSIQETSAQRNGRLEKLAIDSLQPGIYQPRKDMTEVALRELSDSIKQQGLLQPIVVRMLENQQYEIIAGERRWRASKLAGLKDVPVIVHDVDDKTSLAMALVENIQREDLNPIEEARSLSRLIKEFDLTHQQAAEAVSKSRATITNLLRLMHLQPVVQTLLENGDIEMGHARALLGLDGEQQVNLAKQIVELGYTVRDTESAVRRILNRSETASVKLKSPQVKQFVDNSAKQLESHLKGKVKVKSMSSGKFKVEVVYGSQAELEKLLQDLL